MPETALQVHRGDGHALEAAPASPNMSLQIRSLDDLLQVADLFARSGFFKDSRDASKAAVKIMAGAELGLSPIESMRSVHCFEGQIALHYTLVAARIKQSGVYDYRIVRSDATGAEVEFFERGQSVGTASFLEPDAKAAGLLVKNNWKSWPVDMYFGRALTRGARRFCPSVFNGPIYTPEELQNGGGIVIEPVQDVQAEDVTDRPARAARPAQQTPGYDEKLAQLAAWLDAKRPLDLDEALQQAGEKVETWPEEYRGAAFAAIEKRRFAHDDRMTTLQEMAGEVLDAYRDGDEAVERVLESYRSAMSGWPDNWKQYGGECWDRATQEAIAAVRAEQTEAKAAPDPLNAQPALPLDARPAKKRGASALTEG